MRGRLKYEEALSIISAAGDVKYLAEQAKQKIIRYDFINSQNDIDSASEKLLVLHEMFREGLQEYLDSELGSVNLLDVHAQTHLAMAEEAVEHISDFFTIYKKFHELEARLAGQSKIRILLVCAEGVSTSLLVNYIRPYASDQDVVEAISANHLHLKISAYDVILIGPQMRYKIDMISKMCRFHKKQFGIIPPELYGKMDGKSIYQMAEKLFEDRQKLPE